LPPPPNRIEFIPVEWYDKIHASNSALKNNLVSATLGTVPKLRAIANDVIFDVLMYMTPEFCEEVLNCVTDQIVELYDSFGEIHKDFSSQG
jgi:phospholipase DDHD2